MSNVKHEIQNTLDGQVEVIIPAEPGLRCVVWDRTIPYWTASSRAKDSAYDAVNQNCLPVIAWSIIGDDPPVPVLSNGKFNSLRNPTSNNTIALIHANGSVDWLGHFFGSVITFVNYVRAANQ